MDIKQYKKPAYSHAFVEFSDRKADNTLAEITICVISRVNILITRSDILTGLNRRVNKYAEKMNKINISSPAIIYPNIYYQNRYLTKRRTPCFHATLCPVP